MLFWEPIIWDNFALFDNHNFHIEMLYGLYVGYFLFFIGLAGLFLRHGSLIYILIAAELMLLGINLVFLFLGLVLAEPQCHLMVLMILTIAAAETTIGLSLLFLYHQIFDSTDSSLLNKLSF